MQRFSLSLAAHFCSSAVSGRNASIKRGKREKKAQDKGVSAQVFFVLRARKKKERKAVIGLRRRGKKFVPEGKDGQCCQLYSSIDVVAFAQAT